MIEKSHPYHFLSQLFEDSSSVFQFSRYVYVPDSILDERECFYRTGREITSSAVEKMICELGGNQELAFHSVVKKGGRTWHIPMIDLAVEEPLTRELIERMGRYIPRRVFVNMKFYSSGRSFHAYSLTLLSPKEWIEFMGRLLLVNGEKANYVDTRWVGHRLIGGFSSLRWSNNSGLYVRMPSEASLRL